MRLPGRNNSAIMRRLGAFAVFLAFLSGARSKAAFSGRYVVTASEDWTAQIWDANTGQRVGARMQHHGAVYSAVFSPDGQYVATASGDGTARVWEAKSGKPMRGVMNMMALAKQAARNAGVRLETFFGVVLIMNIPIGAAQGGLSWPGGVPGPGVFADCRRVNNQGRQGIHQGNGTEIFGQEMGHGYGLNHSRRDGSDVDYQDFWDIMSTAKDAFSALDPNYAARGPGLNAWNMRGEGWLDESRVWHGPNANFAFSERVQLRPLHRRDLPGPLAAELPPTGGHSAFLIEFRAKERWDAGIPRAAMLVHRFENNVSYIMSGKNGNKDLVDGDLLDPGTSSDHFHAAVDTDDLPSLGTNFALPFFVFQGGLDNVTPVEPVKAYVATITAPQKQLVLIVGAGHNAIATKSDEFLKLLDQWVRPLAKQPDVAGRANANSAISKPRNGRWNLPRLW
jgi:pimeloyl-ACP methyl ester carboxylesterase